MGCQVFEITVELQSGKRISHNDSYFVGEKGGQDKVVNSFKDAIK